ncbi:TetR/AcrR family transcriptional regulator [Iodobacter ciconiae]|uniref:TetR/AcrR family transcriptional regulator n=1 Tax=Iodobacter ciconiae TaxID=2496266 RepID=A0A3S8ZU37_9NEIS|nr:TetR/AcrR family transcriptional regulator [Iodobacter ciconiae]AZN36976.1 TetR/AcrR family transcriptional regulator [Iodobacter ciconiae]
MLCKRWTRRKEARPLEILEAALGLFVSKGYAATKMTDIAKAAGVTCGTPYIYFAGKEEIFEAVMREILLPRLTLGHELLANFQGNSADLLRAMLKTWWQAIGENQLSAFPKLMITEGSNFPLITKIYQEEFVAPGNKLLRQILERGIASGEFRVTDIDYAIEVISSPIIIAMLSRHTLINCLPDQFDPERFLNTTLDTLLNGLIAPLQDKTHE